MDSITQAALGGAIGHAVLGRRAGRKAAAWGAVCGTLPDLDVLVPMGHDILDFTLHRSASHSLLVLPLVAPAVAWVITRIHPDTRAHWRGWLLLALLALTTHPLLDGFTVYGTQLLWPLRAPPVTWSTLFIIDPIYTVPLLTGLGAALLWHGGTGQAARGSRWNAWGLALSSVYLVFALGAKLHVEHRAHRDLAAQGVTPDRVLTVAAPFTTLLWRIVAVEGDEYYEGFYSLVDGSEEPVQFASYPRRRHLLASLRDRWEVAELHWFTKGFWAAGQRGDDIYIADLRMGFEPSYIFAFAVGVRRDDLIEPGDGRQLRLFEFEADQLAWVWRRIWAETSPGRPVVRLGSAGELPEVRQGG